MTKEWHLAHGRSIHVGTKAIIMGILNVTPDSFPMAANMKSWKRPLKRLARCSPTERQSSMLRGIDPSGAAAVDAETEIARVIPVIEALARRFDCIISIDTYRAATAQAAVNAGAHIVNDVWGSSANRKLLM